MIFDLQRMLEGKRLHRERLASRSIVDKLGILDALRERELTFRGRANSSLPRPTVVRKDIRSTRTDSE